MYQLKVYCRGHTYYHTEAVECYWYTIHTILGRDIICVVSAKSPSKSCHSNRLKCSHQTVFLKTPDHRKEFTVESVPHP